MLEIFQYGFLLRALVVGLLVSLCAALLGVSLVLKRFSMIGDGLSHAADFPQRFIGNSLNTLSFNKSKSLPDKKEHVRFILPSVCITFAER